MKKIFLSIAFVATGLVASAQVGVGTENPQTSLHIVGANATDKGSAGTNVPGALVATDGITVPVVTNDMTLAVPAQLVAGTKVSQMVYSNFTGKEGFYFWDGVKWSAIKAATVAKSVRIVTASSPLTNADLNGYVIFTGASGTATFSFGTILNPTIGDTITITDAGGGDITCSGLASGSSVAPTASQGGGMSFVYSANGWFHTSRF